MNRLVFGTILVICTCYLYSCSFLKLVAGKKPEVYVWKAADSLAKTDSISRSDSVVSVADSAASIEKLIGELTPLWTNRLQYNTFSGKAKMHMEAPNDKHEFTAHFRLRKDSLIWINITALGGLSFARVLVTPDSFFMVNNYQKTAVRVSLNNVSKILPSKVDFSSLQNLILGEPLRDGKITAATVAGDKWVLHVEDTSYIQEITYSRADSTMSFAQLLTYSPNGPKAITRYNQYEWTDGRRMSTDRILNLQNGNDFYTLEMNFTKVNFDETLEYPFSIPKNYEINPSQKE